MKRVQYRHLSILAARFVLFAVVFAAWPALAHERPRVVVVSARTTPFNRHLCEGIDELGFEAGIEPRMRDADHGSELAQVAERWDAVAAVWVLPSGDTSKVMLFERATGKVIERELGPELHGSEAELAQRVLARIRGDLLALAARTGAASLNTRSRRGMATTDAAVGTMYSPGRLPPVLAVSGSAGLFLRRALSIEAFALIPLMPMKRVTDEGTSVTRVSLVGADLRGEIIDGPLWQLSLAIGAAGTFFASERRRLGPEESIETTKRVSGCVYLRAAAGYRLSHLFALGAQLLAGTQLHPFVVDLGERTARWGRPWVTGLLALQVRIAFKE